MAPKVGCRCKDPLPSRDGAGRTTLIRRGPPAHPADRPDRKERTVRKLGLYLTELLRREDGPTAVEYAVMLALIIVVCITAITTLGKNANNTFTNIGNNIAAA